MMSQIAAIRVPRTWPDVANSPGARRKPKDNDKGGRNVRPVLPSIHDRKARYGVFLGAGKNAGVPKYISPVYWFCTMNTIGTGNPDRLVSPGGAV